MILSDFECRKNLIFITCAAVVIRESGFKSGVHGEVSELPLLPEAVLGSLAYHLPLWPYIGLIIGLIGSSNLRVPEMEMNCCSRWNRVK